MILQKDLSLSHFFVPSQKEQKSLVMLLHGYGSNAEQLLHLTGMFKYLKHTSFVIPNAPFSGSNDFIDEGDEPEDVYQWFPLHFSNHGIEIKTVDDIANACKIVEKFMHEVENKYKVKCGDISFFWFFSRSYYFFIL